MTSSSNKNNAKNTTFPNFKLDQVVTMKYEPKKENEPQIIKSSLQG